MKDYSLTNKTFKLLRVRSVALEATIETLWLALDTQSQTSSSNVIVLVCLCSASLMNGEKCSACRPIEQTLRFGGSASQLRATRERIQKWGDELYAFDVNAEHRLRPLGGILA